MAANDFPPVGWLNKREPWTNPQYIPGYPHNLPAKADAGMPSGPGTPSPTTTNFPGYSSTVSITDPYRFSSLVDLSIITTTTSVKFLDQPIGKRNTLGFRNASASSQIIYIGFGGNATTNSWLQINPNSVVLFDTVVPQDDLYVISNVTGGVLAYVYSTYPG
jgi:hypothetical protein